MPKDDRHGPTDSGSPWPERGFTSEYHGIFEHPDSPADAERMLTAAYAKFEAGEMSRDQFDLVRDACWKAAHNDGAPSPWWKKLLNPMSMLKGD